jgi:thymidylate kinase
LIDVLREQDYKVESVWSRFNNYLSKPLLALTRLSGHNHRSNIDGIKYGFHDFEKLYLYRELFALLQAIDTNIAAYFKISKKIDKVDCLICERSPWDSLVDVIVDTGRFEFVYRCLSGLFLYQVRRKSLVLFIDRDHDKIIASRPELKHDYKMNKKISTYRMIAKEEGWCVVDNNGSIENTRNQILEIINWYLTK